MIKLKKFSSTKSTWDALENCINENCSGPIKELIAAGESQDKIKDTINYVIDHIMEDDSESREFSSNKDTRVVFIKGDNILYVSPSINSSRSASLQSNKIRKKSNRSTDTNGMYYGADAYILNDSAVVNKLLDNMRLYNQWLNKSRDPMYLSMGDQASKLVEDIYHFIKSNSVFSTKDADKLKDKLIEFI